MSPPSWAGDCMLTLNKVNMRTRYLFYLPTSSPLAVTIARKLLSEDEIAVRLREVSAWSRKGKAIERSWTFRDFPEALAFINKVGELAEVEQHHPDIHNSWNRVRLSLTTHDRGGLTDRDFSLARRIDALTGTPGS